jgi:glutamate--cysteine ligase regulatory subunit
VKLFYLPNTSPSCRSLQTNEAIALVLGALNVPSIDLLIVSFPDITFDADDDSSDSESDPTPSNTSSSTTHSTPLTNGDTYHTHTTPNHESITDSSSSSTSGPHPDNLASMIPPWRALESLHTTGVISRLGISEFGVQRLGRLLRQARVRPGVDQINVRDCCVVPKPLILFARREGIELLTHNDCTNILPSGTLRELLGGGDKGFGVLAAEGGNGGLRGDVRPEVVVKYTAVVKDTGVVENKGYFAVAELREEGEASALSS